MNAKMNWLDLMSSKRFGDKNDFVQGNESRSRFEQDFDRLIFSHPFRRLQDKTQVFPLPEDDFVHTRLTHSLEVSSVGRSLGKAVGGLVIKKYADLAEVGYTIHDFGGIVAAASLAHDLGNPPFGHSGESAISAFYTDSEAGRSLKGQMSDSEWCDLTSFEGNAQGFRILNDDWNGGLRLTYACLGAFTKYPKSSTAPKDNRRKSQKKYGFYQSESKQFTELAENMNLRYLGTETWCRHPLSFLVEAADDICYGIIDLEDGCRLGLVSFEEVKSLLVAIIGKSFSEEKLNRIKDQNSQLGLLRAMTIHQLIQESVSVFEKQEEEILSGEFDEALTGNIPSADVLANISSLSIRKIYRSRQVLERESGGFEVIGQLMKVFIEAVHSKLFRSITYGPKYKSIYRLLPELQRQKLEEPEVSVYLSCMIIGDFISSLTDTHAIKLYRIINGFSLPVSRG